MPSCWAAPTRTRCGRRPPPAPRRPRRLRRRSTRSRPRAPRRRSSSTRAWTRPAPPWARSARHRATITPTKQDLIAAWAPTQPWGPSPTDAMDVIGSYRFDDPDGRVGMETHLVSAGGVVLQVPLTYRDEPLAGAEHALISEMEH